MRNVDKRSFEDIINDSLLNKKFNKLSNDEHHGITRYEHSIRVAKYSFLISKKFGLKNVRDITSAALLHDFYINNDLKGIYGLKKWKKHPSAALNNSLNYYNLNDMQKDIIVNHMFPVTKTLPKYKESYLVSSVDKVVGLYEMLRYKIPFIFKKITIRKNLKCR